MDLAKEMTKEALPIKCLEAVILGMYPSSGLGESVQSALAGCCQSEGLQDSGAPTIASLSWAPAKSGFPKWRNP